MSDHDKKKKKKKQEKKMKKLMRKYYEENRDGYWEGVIANAKDEAKAEERKNLLAAARTLLAEGMDRLKVQRYTQLTDAKMASICEVN